MTKTELINRVGSAAAVARIAGVSKQAVSQWPDERIPAERVPTICAALGTDVSPHDLRPDVFREEWTLPAGENNEEAA